MKLVQVETSDRRRVEQFLRFPFDLYQHSPQWVPPMAGDTRRVFDRKRHPFYRHSDAAFAYPDISAALQRTGGRLIPFGWWTMWRELKRTKWINVNGAAILEEYQGLGGTAILFSEMQKSVAEGGYEHADLVQIGVENDRMQRELEGLGIDFYKIHRTYRRSL